MSIKNRYELMFFVACTNGNPNGDPDSDNMPRLDPETNIGLISDCAIKRRIRDYVIAAHAGEPGMEIMMQPSVNLNRKIAEAKAEAGQNLTDVSKSAIQSARERACQKFFDVRSFGAVMSTGPKAGQVRGPVQFTFGRSLSPIFPEQMAVTRVCSTDDVSKGKKGEITVADYVALEESTGAEKLRTIGRKQYIPFGLYEVRCFVSANLSDDTGFDANDLHILFEAVMNMYELDHSASRGEMAVVSPLIIFKHVGLSDPINNAEQNEKSAKLGCAPSHKLFELVNVQLKDGVTCPRSYRDYDASINFSGVPRGVEIGFFDGNETTWGKLPESETWLK